MRISPFIATPVFPSLPPPAVVPLLACGGPPAPGLFERSVVGSSMRISPFIATPVFPSLPPPAVVPLLGACGAAPTGATAGGVGTRVGAIGACGACGAGATARGCGAAAGPPGPMAPCERAGGETSAIPVASSVSNFALLKIFATMRCSPARHSSRLISCPRSHRSASSAFPLNQNAKLDHRAGRRTHSLKRLSERSKANRRGQERRPCPSIPWPATHRSSATGRFPGRRRNLPAIPGRASCGRRNLNRTAATST